MPLSRHCLTALACLPAVLLVGQARGQDDDPPKPPNPEAGVPTLEWRPRHVFKFDKHVYSVCLSPDGKLLAAGVEESGGRIWDTRTGKEVARFGKEVVRLHFAPDSRTLAWWVGEGGPDNISLSDTSKKEVIRTFKVQRHDIHQMRFSPDGKLLATAAGRGGVKVWEVATGKETGCSRTELDVSELAFSPDGKILAIAVWPNHKAPTAEAQEGAVRLLDVATGKEVRRLSHPRPDERPRGLAFSPDGSRLAVGNWRENVIYVCNPRDGKLVRQHTWPRQNEGDRTDGIYSLAFAADGLTWRWPRG